MTKQRLQPSCIIVLNQQLTIERRIYNIGISFAEMYDPGTNLVRTTHRILVLNLTLHVGRIWQSPML